MLGVSVGKVQVNPIDVIEASYDLDGPDQRWLERLALAVRPLIDGGRGTMAYFYDAQTPLPQTYASALRWEMPDSLLPAMCDMAAASPDVAYRVHIQNEVLLGLVDLGKRAGFGDLRERPSVARYFQLAGISDFVALQTVEPGGHGVVITAGQREVRKFDTRTRRLWARVNTHIAAGRRLRAALAAKGAQEDAVLTPNGKLEHAEAEAKTRTAREVLRDAVQRIEKARGKQRRTDPEAATEAWNGLVSGRWSLVDRFERGGRRYIVARRNEHTLPDPRALTPRERVVAHLAALGKSNKLIGYELGISGSTIAGHLASAMRKLGAKTRADLIQLVLGILPPA